MAGHLFTQAGTALLVVHQSSEKARASAQKHSSDAILSSLTQTDNACAHKRKILKSQTAVQLCAMQSHTPLHKHSNTCNLLLPHNTHPK